MNQPLKPTERMEVPSHARLIWISVLTLFVSMGAAATISAVRDVSGTQSGGGKAPVTSAAPASWAIAVPSASEVLPITSGGYPEDAPSTF